MLKLQTAPPLPPQTLLLRMAELDALSAGWPLQRFKTHQM